MHIPYSLKIIFAGTSYFSSKFLDVLLSSQHIISGILTQPDRISGRGKKIHNSPIKKIAKHHNIPIFQPCSSKELDDIADTLKAVNCDIILVIAYSIILSKKILSLPKLGCINLHGSLLPRWRGSAPVNRAIQFGDKETGMTFIKMDEKIDTGPILHTYKCDITDFDTTETVLNKLYKIGTYEIIKFLYNLSIGNFHLYPQNNLLATYAKKVSKNEAKIDWNIPAIQLERNIRAFNPWPVSYFWASKTYVKIWKATIDKTNMSLSSPGEILKVNLNGIYVGTGKGILVLKILQLSGRKKSFIQESWHTYRKLFIPGNFLL